MVETNSPSIPTQNEVGGRKKRHTRTTLTLGAERKLRKEIMPPDDEEDSPPTRSESSGPHDSIDSRQVENDDSTIMTDKVKDDSFSTTGKSKDNIDTHQQQQHQSRYDLTTMNRIVDTSDRSSDEESSGGKSDDANNIIMPDKVKDNSLLPTRTPRKDVTHQQYQSMVSCLQERSIGQTILQIASIGIVVSCIGLVAHNNKNNNAPRPQLQRTNAPADVLLRASNDPKEEEGGGGASKQLHLLEIAEEVVLQCSEDMFNVSGMEACQILCQGRLCCFEEGDEYSCEDDTSVNCPVYAGCEALILGFL